MTVSTRYQRRPFMFTDADGNEPVVFPQVAYEYESYQTLRAPSAALAGADFAHDYLGRGAGVKDDAREVVRFHVFQGQMDDQAWSEVQTPWSYWGQPWALAGLGLDGAVDLIRSRCLRHGRGKLWTRGRDGTLRWAYARLAAVPGLRMQTATAFRAPMSLEFRRSSDWHREDQASGSVAIAASPTTVAVANPGNQTVRNAVFTLAGAFTDPTVENLTTDESLSTSRDGASVQDVLRVDAGALAVEFSDDGGETFTSDYDLVTLGATQVALLTLAPGENAIRITGATSATLGWSFYPAYE